MKKLTQVQKLKKTFEQYSAQGKHLPINIKPGISIFTAMYACGVGCLHKRLEELMATGYKLMWIHAEGKAYKIWFKAAAWGKKAGCKYVD